MSAKKIYRESESNVRVSWIFVLVFFALALLGAMHHELWLDEAHHWLMARDSKTLKDLWVTTRYDGHPIAWNIVLFIISRFSNNVFWMQLTHVVLATVGVAIVVFYSPFRWMEKILFVSGYFIAYEYAVISRNYALLMVFLFLTIVLYSRRNYLALGVTLTLLANTHLFGLAIASLFAGMIILEFVFGKERTFDRRMIAGIFIFLAGIALSLWQIIPPPDSTLYTKTDHVSAIDRAGRASVVFLKALIPLPDIMHLHPWNTNLLMAFSKPLCVMLSLVLFFVPAFLFKKRISLLLFFYGNAGFLVLFFYLADFHAARYFGVIYLVFVSCVWLNRSARFHDNQFLKRWDLPQGYAHRFFIILLVIHAIAGVESYLVDLFRPFSGSKDAATLVLSGDPDAEYLSAGCGAGPVSAYLGRPIFYFNDQAYGSFCLFNRAGNGMGETQDWLKQEAIRFVTEKDQVAFLITHSPFTLSAEERKHIAHKGSFTNNLLRNENVYVYRISP